MCGKYVHRRKGIFVRGRCDPDAKLEEALVVRPAQFFFLEGFPKVFRICQISLNFRFNIWTGFINKRFDDFGFFCLNI